MLGCLIIAAVLLGVLIIRIISGALIVAHEIDHEEQTPC